MSLVLASTSRYRRELLQRLGLPFDCARPEVDETPLNGETPLALAMRLATAKATEVAARHPGAWVIGSDQVADLNGRPLGKPGTAGAACAQLAAMSGQTVRFHTAISLTRDGESFSAVDLTEVRFRALGQEEIARYVATEQPLDCAGSFKCEGLGISLFEAIDNRDPTALIGLPLIALCGLLRQAGFAVP
ncbi:MULTISPECIES: nucleoside triphosphate pyrophosphatase [Stenotrophomonas]|uniref:Maf family protein n=1 Tax=Stenotrophomonas TaxID=40323 RepID=UPI00191F313A|nr:MULTISPECIES: Maf family nucleotide pyrophosphatase [Stenotrophomonas]EKT4098445.1 septum formation inhibitor Maf [Stenotrophomonas maltophilia]MBL0733514.1 septum formation inhibitor Maf [Stenotrophomonas maltophilia]MBL0755427.1 septum formation inhibitor Maf [Stenotrophomonas maltophilia]HEL4857943.1 septum formation inhibitor Maf [Stenotrophomonas maltophilia]HEL7633204.1 septum formation inhibitor Maf [Stenotrophomonas maltophilia]